jgi:hypothetical protein
MNKKRAMASARAATNCPFDILAGMLMLEPKEDWHLWFDPEGNRLRIFENRAVKIYPAAIPLSKTKDVFRKARPELIEKYSYWAMPILGKNKNILILLGNDGKLRSCYFEDNIWKGNISPLLLGINILRYVSNGYLETESRPIKLTNISYPKDFEIEEAWASGLPIEEPNLQRQLDAILNRQRLQFSRQSRQEDLDDF